MKQEQIRQNSGSKVQRYSLDAVTWEKLKEITETLKQREVNVSEGIIVRRAIRAYLKILNQIINRGRFEDEKVFIQRARKGVA